MPGCPKCASLSCHPLSSPPSTAPTSPSSSHASLPSSPSDAMPTHTPASSSTKRIVRTFPRPASVALAPNAFSTPVRSPRPSALLDLLASVQSSPEDGELQIGKGKGPAGEKRRHRRKSVQSSPAEGSPSVEAADDLFSAAFGLVLNPSLQSSISRLSLSRSAMAPSMSRDASTSSSPQSATSSASPSSVASLTSPLSPSLSSSVSSSPASTAPSTPPNSSLPSPSWRKETSERVHTLKAGVIDSASATPMPLAPRCLPG